MITLDRRGLAGLSIGSLFTGLLAPMVAQASGIMMKQNAPFLRLHHLFDGPDGKSKLEIIDMASKDIRGGAFKYLFESPAESMYISAGAPGEFIDWHAANRPQFFIQVQGMFETGLEDGSKHRLPPGEFLLAEDKNPKGHTSRVVSDEWAIQLCCVLKDTGDVYRPTFPQ